ncbi:MAG TPA: vitamin K epoxide reductase family protein, partial [Thermoanaerobaculia bacterium]|nr:vitamin K epoxide reductase family protein [Thermoanaerobaculia bacterium]
MTSVGRKGRSAGERSDSKADAAGPRAWAALAGLGALSALWSLFLWGQLVLSRSGGGAFCAFGGQLDCSSVWGSAFASAVHGLTGLPIAGWGVVWGATAMALPLAGLTRLAEGRSVAVLTTAVRLTAVAGILAVGVFLAESLAAGAICVGCVATYVLAGAYAGIALWGWRRAGFRDAVRSAALAGGSVAAAFLLLLYPGLHTP